MFTTGKRNKRPSKDLRRPLSRKALDRARTIVARYQITLWREDGEWYGQGVEESGTYEDGKTIVQCARKLREALAITVAGHIEAGEPVITPIVDRDRKLRAG